MATTEARGRMRRARADDDRDGTGPGLAPSLPDRLTAEIDDQLDAELLATASTVGAPDPEPEPTLARAGELAETDVALLLGRAYQEVWTGQLSLRAREVEKSIHFDAGRPVYAASSALEDRLCEMLLRQGRLDSDQRGRVARQAAGSGRRTGAVLVDLGLLKPGELMPALRTQHEEIILSLFPWTEGRFRFDPRSELEPRKTRLLRHPAALVREALRRDFPATRIQRHLGEGTTLYAAARGPEATDLLAELALEPAERELLGWFDGRRSLEDIARTSGRPDDLVARLALVLVCFGLLTPVKPGRARGRRTFDQRVDRERILARYALSQDADYFQILGVAREATAAEVARAHRRLSEDIGPQRVDPEVAVTLARELEIVRDVLAEAGRVLGDEALRRRYREHLLPPTGRRP